MTPSERDEIIKRVEAAKAMHAELGKNCLVCGYLQKYAEDVPRLLGEIAVLKEELKDKEAKHAND